MQPNTIEGESLSLLLSMDWPKSAVLN